jgi:bifunctional non-homologous end joining protein LigD
LRRELAKKHSDRLVYLAFDLLYLDGYDLRGAPLIERKRALQDLLAKAPPKIHYVEHFEMDDGEAVYRHACKLKLEGIVSKRKNSPYRSGRSPDWLKMKNANAPAVKREAEEDWGKDKWRSRVSELSCPDVL